MDGGHKARRTVTGRILHRRKLRKAAGVTAGDLMTSPAVTGRTQDTAGQATRVMDHHGLKLLLIANEAGQLAGIVSRTDALAVFDRTAEEIRVELRAG